MSVVRPVPESLAERLAPAAATFASQSFEDTRIEDVAEATGIPRATLYYYFRGKEDVLGFLLLRMLHRATEAVGAAAAGPGTGRERLEAVIRAQLELMADEPATCRALILNLGRAAKSADLAAAVDATFYAPLRVVLAQGSRDRSLRKLRDTETVASAIFGAVTTAALHYLVASDELPSARVTAELVDLLVTGLAAGKGS